MLTKNIKYSVSGLEPNQEYFYIIENLYANWPITIVPGSGKISSINSTIDINTNIIFCETLSSCDDYMPYTTGSFQPGDNPYVDIRLKLTSDILENSIFSNTRSVICSGCAPVPYVSIDNNTNQLINTNTKTINFAIGNLKPYTAYNYVFNDINSNYPVLLINIPKSGTFISSSASSYDLKADLVFCSFESCSSPTFGSGYIDRIEQQQCEKYFTNFNLSLTSDYLISAITSEPITLECDDCLPKTVISTEKQINLDSSSLNTHTLLTSISGLKPHNRYEYSILYKDSNHMVSFNNLSGYFYTTKETVKNIETQISFCESSGLCQYHNTLGTASNYDCSTNKFIEFSFKLDSECLQDSVFSETTRVDCKNCLPVVSINTPPKAILTAPSGNVRNFNIAISGLKPYSEYFYSFNNVNSNHLVGLKQLSGVVKTKNNTSATIANSLIFCESSGYCNSYFTNGSANTDVCNNLLFADFDVELNSSCLSQPVVSDKIHVECDNCFNIERISIPNKVTLTHESGNSYSFRPILVNLKPYSEYTYFIKNVDTNHLIGFKESSGIIKTLGGNFANIRNNLTFCEGSGYCSDSISFGSMNSDSCNNTLFANFNIELNSSCLDKPIMSDKIEVDCDNCLPNIAVSLLDNDTLLSTTNIANISGLISGLKPKNEYEYYFSYKNNWPVVLENSSGSFKANKDTYDFSTKIAFCKDEVECLEEINLLNYTLDSKINKDINNNTLYSDLILNIRPKNCSDIVYSSNEIKISCVDCIPCVSHPSVLIEGSPVIVLDEDCCKGQKLLNISVSGAIPGEKYSYKFIPIGGIGVNYIEIFPTSGDVYFASGGNGNIRAICNVDLENYTQTLINFELTHSNSKYKITDVLGLVCNSGICSN
jgi:hypothetical protein